MADKSSILTIGTFVSAFIGALFGVLLDRFWRRIEARPLFRIQLGGFEDLQGRGRSLTITNVGLEPVQEYTILLFHPQRGTLGIFRGDRKKLVFPQYPDQENNFQCLSQPNERRERDTPSFIQNWLLHLRDEPISAPSFVDFNLRLVMRNSEVTLFEDKGLGNCLAKQLYEDVTGKSVEQDVKPVYYRSKAPFWVEKIRQYKARRMFRKVEREGCLMP